MKLEPLQTRNSSERIDIGAQTHQSMALFTIFPLLVHLNSNGAQICTPILLILRNLLHDSCIRLQQDSSFVSLTEPLPDWTSSASMGIWIMCPDEAGPVALDDRTNVLVSGVIRVWGNINTCLIDSPDIKGLVGVGDSNTIGILSGVMDVVPETGKLKDFYQTGHLPIIPVAVHAFLVETCREVDPGTIITHFSVGIGGSAPQSAITREGLCRWIERIDDCQLGLV